MHKLAFLAAALTPAVAAAHPGHGIEAEWHAHAGDALGLLALAVGVGVALWLLRGK
ncbi:MAG: hypothetical protein H0W40_15110 [Methylibium sp.]|uniref:hypothetical protein n=1 Tax=Methylibium sp. TaxID=2067992 RepID=UPI001798E38A|nr:hypothetical protein [Methylibium sp.]MBA3598687.1 hypothetical protein [Methylibium sp.]